jgi:hypothetical protein
VGVEDQPAAGCDGALERPIDAVAIDLDRISGVARRKCRSVTPWLTPGRMPRDDL